MKKGWLSFFALFLLLGSCSQGASSSEPLADNVYDGGGTFAIDAKTWFPSDSNLFDITYGEEGTRFAYEKTYGQDYTFIHASISGPLADFVYFTIKAKGDLGKSVTARIVTDETDSENSNLVGTSATMPLTEEFTLLSVKVKDTYRTRLDLATAVQLYPEIGLSGTDASGTFTLQEAFFSTELPAGSTCYNAGIDTGDDSISVNGWKTYPWTHYTLTALAEATYIKFVDAADYAYIEKELDLKDEDNKLTFAFTNESLSGLNNTTTRISFILRGDVDQYISEGVEYPYYTYYQQYLYYYRFGDAKEVVADSAGLISLEIPLLSALSVLKDHRTGGLRLTLLIESDVAEKGSAGSKNYDGWGAMTIKKLSTSYDSSITDNTVKGYSVSDGSGTYVFTSKSGVDCNISYTNVLPHAYWPRVIRSVECPLGKSISLAVRNNKTTPLAFWVHAGHLYEANGDTRTNAVNNWFFPLYQNKGIPSGSSYFEDGEKLLIPAGETHSFTIGVDSDSTFGVDASKDTINSLQFFIDNCYSSTASDPDYSDEAHSGDIDIVSIALI